MLSDRMANGVRGRLFRQHGDPWALEHRRQLGPSFYLDDIDLSCGLAFGARTEDRTFYEYQPDGFEHVGQLHRDFALVAVFDRSESVRTAFAAAKSTSTAFQLHICRTFAAAQPVAPRFFHVVGLEPPFEMHELDIDDGYPCSGVISLPVNGWLPVWHALGLDRGHQVLRQWVLKGRP
jgi:hypothetical protein